jgi:hypothetical protein
MMSKVKLILLKMGYNLYEAVKWGWVPYLLLLSVSLHGQSSERTQKQAKVIEHRQQSQSNQTTYTQGYQQGYTRGYNDNFNNGFRGRTPYYYDPTIWGYTPYWNPYRRWNGREYIITKDNDKVSPRPPMRISVGVLSEVTTQQSTLSPYLVLGTKTFGFIQYHMGGLNNYPYYNNIYPWEVEAWEDESMGLLRQRRELVLGIGSSVERVSPFVGIGFGMEKEWDSFFDETYTLSSTGIYTISERSTTIASIKVGTMYHWDRWEIMTQLSIPYGMDLQTGMRLGLGMGLKL